MIKVLLIEDDIIDQLALTRLIKKNQLECELTTAIKIQEAKILMERNSFDLIVCDLNLPDGKAFDLGELIRKQPFILLSGHLDPESIRIARQHGAVQVLQKSSDLNQLTSIQSLIRSMLHQNTEPLVNTDLKEDYISSAFNLDKLMYVFDNSVSEVASILEIFLEENPRKLTEMEKTVATNDWEAMEQIAHKIKSNFSLVGLKEARIIAQEIEVQCQAKTYDKISDHISALRTSVEAAYPKIELALLKLK